jgi:DNA-binding protein YbaB
MVNESGNMIELFDEFYFIEEEPVIKQVKESENPIKINFEGGNNQRLLFIHERDLSARDKDMLHKLIHNAMKLTMEHLAIINLAQNAGVGAAEMINIMEPKHVIIWGAGSWVQQQQLQLTAYMPSTSAGVSWLHVDAVEKFHDNVPLKTALWNGIQALLKS